MPLNSLKLIGKTSNEMFILRYPNTLLDFCDYDFSVFAEGAIEICNEALKTGTPDYDRISDLRHDIQSAHCYIEHNIRTIYEKVVFDCWIDYVCRRDNIGVSGMWNRYIRCKTPFEKVIFARLSEFRYNRAENEWLNIIRIQDYARTKLDFIFTDNINKIEEVAARRNYFDLIFSVTAHEMGCRIEDLGVTKLFAVGRIPTAPFIFPNISKEIVRHVLTNFDYSDDYSDIGEYTEISDQIAMDAFSRMKAGLPQEDKKVNIPNGGLEKYNDKIYMPCSLKAAIDLEIDVLIEEGSWLSRCKRCKRFFLRNKEHPEEYCSRYVHGGKTCLQIYEEEHPRPTMTPELEERARVVTDEVYSRVDKTMSVKEYDAWRMYLEAMISKVRNGEILPSELENFLDYSLEVDISKSHPILEVAKKEDEAAPKERVVKPFVPERISRSELPAPTTAEPNFEELFGEEPQRPRRSQPASDGFFTSPSFQRQKSERAPISHIIRGGESMGESYDPKPDPAGFTPFGAAPQPAVQPQQPSEPVPQAPKTTVSIPIKAPVSEEPRRTPREELKRLEERLEEEKKLRREQAARTRSNNSRGGSGSLFDFEPVGFGDSQSARERNIGSRNTRPDRRERDNSEAGRWGSEASDRRERDSYPQSRRDRERSLQRQQEKHRQSDLSLADLGGIDTDAFDNLGEPDDLSDFDRGERRSTRDRRYDRDINAARTEHNTRETRDSRDSNTGRRVREERYNDFEEFDPDRLDDLYDRNSREPARSQYNEPEDEYTEDNEEFEIPNTTISEEAAPPRRTVRKNAAALSAYGKMAGASFSAPSHSPASDSGNDNVPRTRSEAQERDMPDAEPYKGIDNIYDVLEQSQTGSERERRRLTDDDLIDIEPSAERPSNRRRSRRTDPSGSGTDLITEVTRENAPEGFWTEERNLFHNTEDDEPEQPAETVREKKNTRSNKTRRLIDTIMREPDDNPNFRNK